jgi:hypothetical protein
MPGYTAQRPSLFGNVGIASPQRPMVDVGDAIDRVLNGTSSLIHQAYLRKLNERQQAHEAERERIADERYQTERTDRQSESDRRYQLEQQKIQMDALKNGITLGTEGGATAETAPATPTLDSPRGAIASAMTAGMSGPMGAPAPASSLGKPVTPGSLGTIPNVVMGEEAPTPPSYDPTRDVTLQRQTTINDQKATTQLQIRAMMGNTAREIAEKRANATVKSAGIRAGATVGAAKVRADASASSGRKGGGIHGAMTSNALEARFEKVDAPAILTQAGWDLDAATQMLNTTPEGQALRAEGFTTRHLAAAWSKYQEGGEKAALHLQSGAVGASPTEATAAVDSTRRSFRRATPKDPTSYAPPAPTSDPRQAAFNQEAKLYQSAVERIKATFSGKELEQRLKAASDRYNARVRAASGK